MSEKTIKFDNIRVNKKYFHKFKQPFNLDLINVDQKVISDKVKHSNNGFKYSYKEGEIVTLLFIISPQFSGHIKYFKNGGKNMSFLVTDDHVFDKQYETWNKIKKTLDIKLHSKPLFYEKYIKAKLRELNGVTITKFLGDEIPKKCALHLQNLHNY